MEQETILIVDDEFINRSLLTTTLEQAGYIPVAVENGLQALTFLDAQIPDLILLDLVMPEMDGFEVLKHIKSDKTRMQIPVIVVSAADDIHNVVTCIEMGAEDHISKPFEPVLLHARVKACLNKNRLIKKEKELTKIRINRAVESGRAQQSAMILHNIGNAVTPTVARVKTIENLSLNQINSLLIKCYEEIQANRKSTQWLTEDGGRADKIFAYLGDLISAAEQNREQVREQCMKIDNTLDYISSILTLQQNYSSGSKGKKEKLNLNRVIEDAIQMQASLFQKHDVVVKKELHKNIPGIVMEKNRLMQMLVNLIKNGCESMDGRSSANTDNMLEFKTCLKNQDILLTITDNGQGIEPENQLRVFDFGYSTKGASGFGLYYCAEFLESCNASIKLRNQEKLSGAFAQIRLPCQTQ